MQIIDSRREKETIPKLGSKLDLRSGKTVNFFILLFIKGRRNNQKMHNVPF